MPHRIKLKPNREQEQYFRRACGIRRFTYKWALAERNRQYELHKQDPEKHPKPENWTALQKRFTQFKKQDEVIWLNEVSAHISNRAIRDLCRAWDNFFKALKRGDRSFKPPRPPRKGIHDRFYVHNSQLRFDDNGKHAYIEKLGWVRCREPLRCNGKIMSGTVSREADGWYLSVQVDIPHVVKPHPAPGSVGVDMGVANQVALSDGTIKQLPMDRIERLYRLLRKRQKALSRKWSGRIKKCHADRALRDEDGQLLRKSNRFIKQTQKAARLHQRIANIRLDALHKLSRWIVDDYDAIAIENLQVTNMTASAKGTIEAPGRNVCAKSGLNRSLLNASLR